MFFYCMCFSFWWTGWTGCSEQLADTADDTGPPHDADGDGADTLAFGGGDCDDGDPDIGPDAPEICNGADDDCDGSVDDEDSSLALSSATNWYPDGDGDGFGRPGGPGGRASSPRAWR